MKSDCRKKQERRVDRRMRRGYFIVGKKGQWIDEVIGGSFSGDKQSRHHGITRRRVSSAQQSSK